MRKYTGRYTDWYPVDVKPVRVGWYHIYWKDNRQSMFNWWWDGNDFIDHEGWEGPAITRDVLKWRGLTEQAK